MQQHQKKDDYEVLFKGVKLSKLEANRVGLTIMLGLLCLLITFAFFPTQSKTVILWAALFYSMIGYFGIAVRVCRDKK